MLLQCGRLGRVCFRSSFVSVYKRRCNFDSMIDSMRPKASIAARLHQCIKQKDVAEAQKVAKEVFDLDPRSDELVDQTVQVVKLLTPHDPSLCKELVQNALKTEETNTDLLYQLGMIHLKLLDFDKASALFDQVLSDSPDHSPALCGKAAVYTKLGQITDAEEVLDSALKVSKDDASTVIQGSVMIQYLSLYASPKYIAKHGDGKLLECCDQILFDPQYVSFIQTLYAVMYHLWIKKDPKRKHYEQRIISTMKCHKLLLAAIRSISNNGYDQAVKTLDIAVHEISKVREYPRVAPIFSQIHQKRASVRITRFNDAGEAAAEKRDTLLQSIYDEYTTAISYDSKNPQAWAGRAEILFEQDKYHSKPTNDAKVFCMY